MNHIGTVFHESFALSRPSITQVMSVAMDFHKQGKKPSSKDFFEAMREETSLGKNYAKAMPSYAIGTGLLENKTRIPTPLGNLTYKYDPNFNSPATLWLMHYHLSAPTGPGPAFWHYLTSQRIVADKRYDADDLADLVEDTRAFVSEHEGTDLADRSAQGLITVYKGTYLKTDALGNLGILEPLDDGDTGFQVRTPDTPPVAAIGYALAHYWQNALPDPDAKFVNLNDLEAFARLLFLNSFQLNRSLRTLQRWGLLEVHQVAPPHQVVRNWETPDVFLERLYE